jgi:hypothetical protein
MTLFIGAIGTACLFRGVAASSEYVPEYRGEDGQQYSSDDVIE